MVQYSKLVKKEDINTKDGADYNSILFFCWNISFSLDLYINNTTRIFLARLRFRAILVLFNNCKDAKFCQTLTFILVVKTFDLYRYSYAHTYDIDCDTLACNILPPEL